MNEADAIARAGDAPRTRDSLAEDLRRLGVETGQIVLVHSSLSALGWVCGGPVAVIQALEDVLGPEGTLVLPAHSGDYGDPERWQNPSVPENWKPIIRASMPAFDPHRTPTRQMGAIAECFRTWPGARRSAHPQVSFAALGPHAAFITSGHTLDDSLGDHSPLARIYDLEGRVLLLGVRYERNTSFHLAEYRGLPDAARIPRGAPILETGERVWTTFTDLDLGGDLFSFYRGGVRRGRSGARGSCRFRRSAPVPAARRRGFRGALAA